MSRYVIRTSALAIATLMTAASAQAATFVVDAWRNSSMGGYGLNTVALVSGYRFNDSVGLEDLWSAGPLPRWSNADGLTGPNRFATGSDESGQAEGTLIGRDFGARQQGNLIAPYGSLVGQIGNGEFFLMLSGMGLIRFMTRRQRV